MKLNPFGKKTSGYFSKLQTEYSDLNRRVDAFKHELEAARQDHETKAQASRDLEARNAERPYLSDAEAQLRRKADEARQRVSELERRVFDLQLEHTRLRWKVEAPTKMAEARETIQRLIRQRESLQAEAGKTGTLIAKLEGRIAQLEERIAAETQAASQAMVEAEGEFVMPEALTKLDVELRVARATLDDMRQKAATLAGEISAIPPQIRETRDAYVSHRAAVAEIELQEQLPTFIEIIARTAVARHLNVGSHDTDRYEIEIPRDVVAAMTAQLEADLPAG